MACQLGNITSPINLSEIITNNFPVAIPLLVNNNVPVSNFLIQISKSSTFNTIDGYSTGSGTGKIYINVNTAGTYYVRISCDGSTWSGYVIFTVAQATPLALSSINSITAEMNIANDGIIVTIPELLYAAPINAIVDSYSNLYTSSIVRVEVSQDIYFVKDVYFAYKYNKGYGTMGLINIPISSITTGSTYYIRAKLYVNNSWEAYTNKTQSAILET
jgi:hypothetical protein